MFEEKRFWSNDEVIAVTKSFYHKCVKMLYHYVEKKSKFKQKKVFSLLNLGLFEIWSRFAILGVNENVNCRKGFVCIRLLVLYE